MTTQAYTRCNSGHYFVGENCPFDGWSSTASKELTAAVKRLDHSCRDVSIENLKQLGVSDDTIARTIVVQFGSNTSVFEALSTEVLVVNGETAAMHDLDENFL